MGSVATVAGQAVIMLILIAVGYGLYRGGLLNADATKQLSSVTIMVINPIVMFNAYQSEFDPQKLRGLLIALVLSVAAQGILVSAATVIVRPTRENCEVERFALSYTNCTFMGIPLVQAAFGADGVFYLTAYITAFNIFMWTHGVILMRGSESEEPRRRARGLLKILFSPALIAVALGLLFYFTGFRLPKLVQEPLDLLGAVNTPLAMIVSGATIAKSGLLECFKDRSVYVFQSLKLIIVPMLLAALFVPMQMFGIDVAALNTTLIAASAPTAAATVMFAYRYGRDEGCASRHFTFSTIASIITIPLIMIFSEFLTRLFIPQIVQSV